jgi:predicted outer membrane repeat protein
VFRSRGAALANGLALLLVILAGCASPPPFTVEIVLTRQSSAGITVDVQSSAPVASVSWVFGDGATSGAMKAMHTYAVRGEYTVNLNVFDADGRHAAAAATLKVGHDWRVPADLDPKKGETIRTILDRAMPGDTVWVSESLRGVLVTKDLELVAAEPCTLTFVRYRDAGGVLRGFTLEGGSGTDSDVSALSLSGSPVRVERCVFQNTHAIRGGAVFAQESAATFEDCQFLSNRSELGGGAVYATGRRSFPSFLQCTFEDNQTKDAGGAIRVAVSTQALLPEAVCPAVTACTFRNNVARQNPTMSGPVVGGAIHVGAGCCVLLDANVYLGNTPGDVAFENPKQE